MGPPVGGLLGTGECTDRKTNMKVVHRLNSSRSKCLVFCSSGIDSKKRRATWIAASQPPAVPTPSWHGRNSGATNVTAELLAHFETRRRRVDPTAIGLIGLRKKDGGISRPPKKAGATSVGHCPVKTR